MKIAIVVDNPNRDLRGLVLLTYHLVNSGASVFIVPMYYQGYDVPMIAPDLIIINYIRENNLDLIKNYKAMGIRLAVLDTEGGVLSENSHDSPKNWALNLARINANNLVDNYFLWGTALHESFLLDSGIEPHKLSVTGCPRYDLCTSPWKSVLESRRHGHILVNTNFSAINPNYTRSSEDEKYVFKSLGWPADYIDTLFNELHTIFPKYIETIAAVAHNLPETTILVRPHPFESSKVYLEKLGCIDNIVIDGSGDILDSIANSQCIIHLNCGSAVETIRLGKVPVSLEFLNTPVMRAHAPLPSTLSYHANSVDNLIHILKDPQSLSQRFDIGSAEEKILRWYHHNDGCASQRISELVARCTPGKSSPSRSPGFCISGSRNSRQIFRLIFGSLSCILGSKLTSSLLTLIQPKRKDKSIPIHNIARLMHAYSRCDTSIKSTPYNVDHAKDSLTRLPLTSVKVSKQ